MIRAFPPYSGNFKNWSRNYFERAHGQFRSELATSLSPSLSLPRNRFSFRAGDMVAKGGRFLDWTKSSENTVSEWGGIIPALIKHGWSLEKISLLSLRACFTYVCVCVCKGKGGKKGSDRYREIIWLGNRHWLTLDAIRMRHATLSLFLSLFLFIRPCWLKSIDRKEKPSPYTLILFFIRRSENLKNLSRVALSLFVRSKGEIKKLNAVNLG